jgi:hypothetical protein
MSATTWPGLKSSASTAFDGASSCSRSLRSSQPAHAHHRRQQAAAHRVASLPRLSGQRQHQQNRSGERNHTM